MDFRRFRNFCTRFWPLPGGESVPHAFIFVDLDGSEQFSDENPQNFGAWGKVLPVRDQKRSERENHIILESTTETCSKHDFSIIFVGYASRIFCDLDGFT